MSDKKKLAIVFGVTGNMAFALANVLIGLKKHSPELIADFIVFEQRISDKDKNLLNSIVPCDFRNYKFPEQGYLTDDTLKKFSELTFSRFECFNLLREYKKVLWLDIDILIQRDITPLLSEYSTGISLLGNCRAGDDFTIEVKGLEPDKENFNAGIMYLQDNLLSYEDFADWCYKKTVEYAVYLKSADQGIINLLIKEKNLNVHRLHYNYNFNPAYGDSGKGATILHTFCPEKFWNYWSYQEWNENNKIWLKMGGTPYKGKKIGLWERKFKDIPHPLKRTSGFIKYWVNKWF